MRSIVLHFQLIFFMFACSSSNGALPREKWAMSPAERHSLLRDGVFTRVVDQTTDPKAEVRGVTMEAEMQGVSYLLLGLVDGTARVYMSRGGGWIGGQVEPAVNAAARELVEVARPWASTLPLVREHPVPASGKVRFSIFTPAGIRAAEADEAELMNGRGELLPLFVAARHILLQFSQLDELPPRDEMGYANCLLAALASGTGRHAIITEGAPPPDPAALTGNAEDLKWIAESGFALSALDSGLVIGIVLGTARFPWYDLRKSEGRIEAQLLGADGGHRQVAFRVSRRKANGRAEIEIAPVRPPPGAARVAAGSPPQGTAPRRDDVTPELKVSVLKSGEILADGNKVSLQELDSLLAAHAQKNGMFWYYREAENEDPPPHALEVFELIMKYRRPISLSSKADFSDSIDGDGNSFPRNK